MSIFDDLQASVSGALANVSGTTPPTGSDDANANTWGAVLDSAKQTAITTVGDILNKPADTGSILSQLVKNVPTPPKTVVVAGTLGLGLVLAGIVVYFYVGKKV